MDVSRGDRQWKMPCVAGLCLGDGGKVFEGWNEGYIFDRTLLKDMLKRAWTYRLTTEFTFLARSF